jgi:hypothetical protein
MIGAATTVISIGLFLFAAKMKIQQEQWKAIADSNGEYHISNHGRVKSHKGGKERILKPGLSGRPGRYWAINICINGKNKMHYIHRLVALTFLSNPDNKPQVNHIDGNKLNNHIDNLEWVTASENLQHAWDTGLNESMRLATIQANSKPVVDIVTGKKYDSLTKACEDISEPYNTHALRLSKKSKLQRFFHL